MRETCQETFRIGRADGTVAEYRCTLPEGHREFESREHVTAVYANFDAGNGPTSFRWFR